MKVCNCEFRILEEKFSGKDIIVYGAGDYFNYYVYDKFPSNSVNKVKYFIDNGRCGEEYNAWGKNYRIVSSIILKNIRNVNIVICSVNSMYDIYMDIKNYELDDSVTVFLFPISLSKSYSKIDKKTFFVDKSQNIPKIIHSFWFSGDKKPTEYQKCIDSWEKFCPDYEIKEWTMNNYDYNCNKFVKKAIEKKKWAFASDFARLDVLNRYGGVYMDMDVELIKPIDCLLKYKAFFTFDSQNDIDLGTFGSIKNNRLIANLLKLYNYIDFDENRMNWLCQPRFIRNELNNYGLRLNGETQTIDGMIFLSRNYLSPLDAVTYMLEAKEKDTIAIHHFNAGWRPDNYRNARIEKNRKLMEFNKQLCI